MDTSCSGPCTGAPFVSQNDSVRSRYRIYNRRISFFGGGGTPDAEPKRRALGKSFSQLREFRPQSRATSGFPPYAHTCSLYSQIAGGESLSPD